MTTPIDELLEKWKEQARTPNAGPAIRGIIYAIADELEAAWTATKAQMVARKEAEKLAEALSTIDELCTNDDWDADEVRELIANRLAAYRAKHPKPQDKTT